MKPTVCRWFKITGTKRGTGWGHSIWEVDAMGPSRRAVVRAPAAAWSNPANAIDGLMNTQWTAPAASAMHYEIDLQQPRAFGGLRVDWGTNHATEMTVDISQNGAVWRTVSTLTRGTGNFDLLLHPATTARYIRLNFKEMASRSPAQIREITIKGPDEMPTPNTLYEVATEKARPGLYPEQFRRRQVYWTILGLPNDRVESLFDEYGTLEPFNGSFTVVPFVHINGRLLGALDAKQLKQDLEKGYLPMPRVTMDFGPVQLQARAHTHGTPSDATTYVRYTLRNTSAEVLDGAFFLAIRPVQVNPTWQYGGLSPIQSIEFTNRDEGAVIRVNNSDKLVALTAPSGFGARAFDMGDIVQDLERGELPPALKVSGAGELVSGALAYRFSLMPAQEASVIIAAPLHGSKEDILALEQMSLVDNVDPVRALESAFDFRTETLKKFWDEQIGEARIDLPDGDVADTIRSQIAYILLNMDGPAIQPGSRNYNRSWMRDGSMTCVSMLRMGVVEPVRKFIDWYATRVTPAGLVPPILDNSGQVNTGFGSNLEYDSQGEFVYLVMEFYRLTGDRAFLEKHFGAMHRAMKHMVTLRDRTLVPGYMAGEIAPERFAGILPASISHEGYSTPVHSYWDDFWALRGWKDGRDAATVLGSNDVAAWADEQYGIFKESLRKSLEGTIAAKNIDFVPGCAEKGDMDATSTAIAISPCDELDVLPRKALERTFDMYYGDLERRATPGWESTFTPYELRSITTFVALGQRDRAKKLLDYIMGHRRPPGFNHLAEVVMGDVRKGGYIGDMPHTWVGSGLVNAVREMLIEERSGKLVILNGTPA
ncbi:MAG TPA: discoidin domain-containing protein, partial [Kiritimatiellia bacterium]